MDKLTEAIAALPWRHNVVVPHEPRMPPHEYILRDWCERGARKQAWEALLQAVRSDPSSYLAYFRGYQRPTRYLDLGEHRYWESRIYGKQFLNRCRHDSTEPVRRVDEGAARIPTAEWGAEKPWWPQGSGFGYWAKKKGQWVFTRTERPGERN